MNEKMAKEVTITIETNSLVVLHARSSGRMWCPGCGAKSELLKLAARDPQGATGWEALRLVIAPCDVHRQQAPDGSALICLNSLLSFIHNRIQSRGDGLRAIKTRVEEL